MLVKQKGVGKTERVIKYSVLYVDHTTTTSIT